MKNSIKFMMIIPAVIAVNSCKINDTEDQLSDPAYILAKTTYQDHIADIFKYAELSDFFQQYQTMRTDREASLTFAKTYFPESHVYEDAFFYEEVQIHDWGRIILNDDGTFTIPQNYGQSFTITSAAPRQFTITATRTEDPIYSDIDLVAKVTCNDEVVTIDNLLIKNDLMAIESVADQPLQRPIISTGEQAYISTTGSLHYDYAEKKYEDDFIFTFYEEFLTIDRYDVITRCKPFDKFYGSSDNYILTE